MYTLYYAPGAASMVVHLALLETGAPHELKRVDLDAGAQRDPEYLKLNPRGVVPTLVVDGQPLAESAALLILLAERHPEASLAPPPGTPERAAWYQWVVYLSNTLMSAFRLWFYPQDVGDTPAVREAVQRRIEGVWELLDAQLATHGPYLLGERFSGADLLLTMLMRWSRNMPRPATEWAALARLAERVRARPSWQRLYEVEGLHEW
ncbi:glutathione S-transferase family protein [Frateuria hangzhouensis]|uniref:glutathione S-transferase family protein n=1 Tax=Frateuria hangzhouensis TaxID=2995589 RepID=UPI002261035E|nr:glutathione S-transferase family protein [Frateuria sp. STR12]MCX7513761.1 glutathione S-transferase family protein [Frateuria sp. STR12]